VEFQQMAVLDCFRAVPRLIADRRGYFFESFKRSELFQATGHVFTPLQVNYSVSRRNTLRGIHGVTLPPGQAKYVTCVRGAALDIVVDLRLGSPTFGQHDTTVLADAEGTSVYIAEGHAHGFLALADNTQISYLCSTPYVPGTQFDVNPFDSELALPWGLSGQPLISDKDAASPSLAEAITAGVLPTYERCLEAYRRHREAGSSRPVAGNPTVPS
jgi:NDP-hexose 3,5-(Or5-) epimerase